MANSFSGASQSVMEAFFCSIEKGEEMIHLDIPLRGTIELHHAVFDINGTLAIDGLPVSGVVAALQSLAEHLALHALSAGTHGNMAALERMLDLPIHLVQSGEEKARYVQQLDPIHVVAIGNGMNDVEMLRFASIGIAIIGSEGTAAQVLQAADVVASGPIDAIDLLLKPKRLVATLRG
jgi:soluble P-type ATPase